MIAAFAVQSRRFALVSIASKMTQSGDLELPFASQLAAQKILELKAGNLPLRVRQVVLDFHWL